MFSRQFCEYISMENLDYKNKKFDRKYLKNRQNNQFLKVKNSLLELEKIFMEAKHRKLKNREEKIEKEIEIPFYEPIIVPKDDMNKFKEQEMKKWISLKNKKWRK